ncbi:ferrochelatase [Adlercreutzia sp. ZJ141]|uniref:ferrochelatase n=1 Tax=Adlercreutzia sp. ZJ141 TaxID=2709406 RepID=UPI0013ECBFA2|nr:ferrochelatase [Adlercreutzia sp. ZJ141]
MADSQKRCGVLLVNTGTPSAPEPRSVRRYLAKFLMDKRIRPMNAVVWWFILHFFILPKRGRVSAEKYRAIWSDEGFFFATTHEKIEVGLQAALDAAGHDAVVRCAMSYSEPTIPRALREMKRLGCNQLVVLPLYPQSAHSTCGAVRDGVKRGLRKARWQVEHDVIDNYHDNGTYIRAIAASIRNAGFNPESDDRLLFSFHSIPMIDIENGDTYELQTSATSLQIASELGIERRRWTIGYQCRFDKSRQWLAPFTRDVLARWSQVDGPRIFCVCPNFAVDCLETLYDIDHDLKPYYFDMVRKAGREPDSTKFTYVPCLNRSKAHVQVLMSVLEPYMR